MTSLKFKRLSKNKRLLKSASVIAVVILLVTIGVVYAFRERAKIALVQTPDPACTFNFSIKKPVPSPSPSPSLRPSPSPSPKPSLCVVTSTPPDHTALCLKNPQEVSIKVHIDSLPNNPPYYLSTGWRVLAPAVGPEHNYVLPNEIKVGETYTIPAMWPGIPSGAKETIDIIIGYNVIEGDRYGGKLLGGACSKGFNYYWTPWVTCP